MAGDVGTELRLVVDLVPDDGVGLAGRHRGTDGESQTPLPRNDQQSQDLVISSE